MFNLNKFEKALSMRLIPDILEIAGLAVISFGVGLIYFPAGIIAAGVSLAFIGMGLERKPNARESDSDDSQRG